MIGVLGRTDICAAMIDAIRDAGAHADTFDLDATTQRPLSEKALALADRVHTIIVATAQGCNALVGPQGIANHALGLECVIVCATIAPTDLTNLRMQLPQRIALIDAPFIGSLESAKNRSLTFLIGGDLNEIEDITPLLGAMGQSFFILGPLGAGLNGKLLHSLHSAAEYATLRLVDDWVGATDLNPTALRSMLEKSASQTDVSLYDQAELARRAAPDGVDTQFVQSIVAALSNDQDQHSDTEAAQGG